MINYGTNDSLHQSNPSDTLASIVQSLAALRKSAPEAQIIVIIPFGQYYAKELKEAVEIHKKRIRRTPRSRSSTLGRRWRGRLRRRTA